MSSPVVDQPSGGGCAEKVQSAVESVAEKVAEAVPEPVASIATAAADALKTDDAEPAAAEGAKSETEAKPQAEAKSVPEAKPKTEAKSEVKAPTLVCGEVRTHAKRWIVRQRADRGTEI